MNPISRLSLRLPLRRTAATLSLVVAAGLASTAVLASPHGGGMGHMGGMGGPGMMMGGRGMDHMLDSVKATAEQSSQIEHIRKAAREDMKAQHEAGRALREQSMALFSQATVDANAAEALRQQMLAQHDQASRRMMQTMLDISRVLTAEQRQQLAERAKQHGDMAKRHQHERRSLEGAKR